MLALMLATSAQAQPSDGQPCPNLTGTSAQLSGVIHDIISGTLGQDPILFLMSHSESYPFIAFTTI